MRFLKEHLWPSVLIAFSVLWTLYGFASGVYDLWTAGLKPMIWIGIGALAFMISITVMLVRFERRIVLSSIHATVETQQSIPPSALGGGSAAARKIFQNEELRLWDLALRGEQLISGKIFVDCIFYGPAALIFGNGVHVDGLSISASSLEDALIEIKQNRRVFGVFAFENCRLERCRFVQIALVGAAADLDRIRSAIKEK